MEQCRLPYRLSDVRPRSMCQLGFEDRDGMLRFATFKERTCEGQICNPSLVDAGQPRSGNGGSRLHRRTPACDTRYAGRRRCTGEARWRYEASHAAHHDAEGGREEVKNRRVVRRTANPVRAHIEPIAAASSTWEGAARSFSSRFVKQTSAGRPGWRARRYRRS
jgi:hypothetical protein